MTTDSFQQAGGDPRAALLAYLDRLQQLAPAAPDNGADAPVPVRSVLRQIRDAAPDGMLSASDSNSVELVAGIFDAIFGERHIPVEIGELIAPLQIATLKAALLDQDFFVLPDHPARRLLDTLISAGIGWDPVRGHDDPLCHSIGHAVARLQQEFDRQFAPWSTAVTEIDSFIGAEQSAAQSTLGAAIADALQQEQMMAAHGCAATVIATRIESGEVAGFVEQFLETKWLPILAHAYSVQQDQPALLDSAISAMDELIWSLKPKNSPAERRDMIEKLPAMLALLNASLNAVEWDDDERALFLSKLAERHASIVRTAFERSPRKQMESAVNIAQKASERRFDQHVRELRDEPADPFVQRVQAMVPGTWVMFAGDGSGDGVALKRRLAWTSPLHSRLVFCDRQSDESFTVNAAELARMLRVHSAEIMLPVPVVERALSDLPMADQNPDPDRP